MKTCAVYKTKKKEGMYLYIPEKEQFDEVPASLMAQFGTPQLVMLLSLHKRQSLAGVKKEALIQALSEQGYYLQMPPSQESLLVRHRLDNGLPAKPERKD